MTRTITYPRRAAAAERNRLALLAACEQLLATRGYDDVSLAEIAGRAGLTAGAVYSLFGSKARLILAVLDRLHAPVPAAIHVEGPLSVVGWVAQYAREHAETPRAGLLLAMQAYAAALAEPEAAAELRAAFSAYRDTVAVAIAQILEASGEKLTVPTAQLAADLLALLAGLTQQELVLGRTPDHARYVRLATALAVGALASGAARDQRRTRRVPHRRAG
jgi:AcrR family transcriptional regulator